jgi:hypothetical protein
LELSLLARTIFPGQFAHAFTAQLLCKAVSNHRADGVFYRTPTIEAVRSWAAATPDQFIFAWKASKFITHWKRLQPTSRNSLDLLETRLKLLGDNWITVDVRNRYRYQLTATGHAAAVAD